MLAYMLSLLCPSKFSEQVCTAWTLRASDGQACIPCMQPLRRPEYVVSDFVTVQKSGAVFHAP